MRSKDGSYAFPFAKIRPMQNIDIQQASGTASKKKGGGGYELLQVLCTFNLV